MKKLLFIATLFVQLLAMPASAQSGMTDQQVLEYTKQATKAGKDQNTIIKELTLRGVSKEQALRVKALYEKQQKSSAGTTDPFAESSASRMRNKKTDLKDKDQAKQLREGDLYSTRDAYLKRTPEEELLTLEEDTILRDTLISLRDYLLLTKNKQKEKKEKRENEVFGREIFNSENLTFEPNINLATPPNYRLGPGDEVIIDIWGASQNTIRETISPDGAINIPDMGPISLNGLTVSSAENLLKSELSKIYADQSNQIRVTLGNSRTIQVNVMGEVLQPGTYTLSSFSTVFHALYSAGGVSDIGSLRNVQVARGGKTVATVDVYDFIMKGRTQDDIRLDEGDVIIVPAYEAIVQVKGNVKRPMKYELRTNESVATLLKYAGGFASDAYTGNVQVIRQNGTEYQVNTVDKVDYSVFQMKDGDEVTVEAILDRFANRLEIRGAVYRPGIYELNGKINTVRALVEKAEGLMADAFTGRAVLYRLRENRTREVKQVNIKGVMEGSVPDIPLQRNDVLYIPSIHDLTDMGTVEVFGQVARPGEYPYADNMTLEDVIIGAGGLLDAASTVRVDVSRRIVDPKGTSVGRETGQMFSFALKDNFVVEGEPGFVLHPYDQIYVRRSPAYQAQQNVKIEGEVLYEGTYALTNKNERLSELLAKAGGATGYAYIRGAKLTRKANTEELERMKDVLDMMRKELGQGAVDSLDLEVKTTFTVGIDLEKALQNPGGDDDIVLREGDIINVPAYVSTVKISGAVMMDNTVSYNAGKGVKYYLSQAGGYSQNAKKNKKFIVYMNGQIAEVKGNGSKQIEPGCEIIVPNKRHRPNVMNNIMGYASSFASLATMMATITNLVK